MARPVPSVLIAGFGSIGRRHAANLRLLGVERISVYDLDARRRAAASTEFDLPTFDTLEQALDAGPSVVLVCTPPAAHLPIAVAAAERGCHLFIEKPLADRLDPLIDRLRDAVARHDIVTLVGCNLRFHHGPSTIFRLLREEAIGRVLGASLEMGYYLPLWHPHEDYRRRYSASRTLGGGIILDAIHELDYARWLFGSVQEVFCVGGTLSSLDIETEDFATMVLRCDSGVIVQIHLDYVQRAYSRWCRVVGEGGTIIWEIDPGTVRMFTPEEGWREFPSPDGYSINEMYVAELRHLVRILDGREPSMQPVDEAVAVLRVALAARESMMCGQKVALT